jgi:predicted MFS family arabinose efflux permease
MSHVPVEKASPVVFPGSSLEPEPGLGGLLVLLLAVTSGLSVASIYYAQPLLEAIRLDVGMSLVGAGLVVTASQIGYAVGLVLIVPLGDLLERRGFVASMCCGIGACLLGLGCATTPGLVFLAGCLLGVLSVAAQVVVAFAASLASPETRGRVVGVVMSGLLLGVLLARTVAGLVAGAWSWRAMFWLAGVVMFGLAGLLRLCLPRYPGVSGLGYPALLRSVGTLLATEPALRRRSLFGALSFGGFSVLWTPLSFLLSAPPFGYGAASIGFFGLAGLAGALAASAAGRLADRGLAGRTTGVTTALLTLSWIPLGFGQTSVVILVAGVVLLDLAAQGLHITNQSEIYRLRPDARSRITAAYMFCFFLGGIAGSALSSLAYARFGWSGVSVTGAAFGLAAFCLWLFGRRA